MSALSEARLDLAENLSGLGYKVIEYVPSGINPPVIVMATGDTWIEQGDTFKFGEFLLHLELFLIAGTGTNAKNLTDLEDMLTSVVLELADTHWTINEVSAPYVSRPNNTEYLTCSLQVSQQIQLDQE